MSGEEETDRVAAAIFTSQVGEDYHLSAAACRSLAETALAVDSRLVRTLSALAGLLTAAQTVETGWDDETAWAYYAGRKEVARALLEEFSTEGGS